MLSKQEEDFIEFWEQNRLKESKNPKYLIIGITSGLLISFLIFFFINSGWYERATMVAYSKFTQTVLLLVMLAISFFVSVFYRNYKCEFYEQQYKELIAKKQKQTNAAKKIEE